MKQNRIALKSSYKSLSIQVAFEIALEYSKSCKNIFLKTFTLNFKT